MENKNHIVISIDEEVFTELHTYLLLKKAWKTWKNTIFKIVK
jgi:hypothetical protein